MPAVRQDPLPDVWLSSVWEAGRDGQDGSNPIHVHDMARHTSLCLSAECLVGNRREGGVSSLAPRRPPWSVAGLLRKSTASVHGRR